MLSKFHAICVMIITTIFFMFLAWWTNRKASQEKKAGKTGRGWTMVSILLGVIALLGILALFV